MDGSNSLDSDLNSEVSGLGEETADPNAEVTGQGEQTADLNTEITNQDEETANLTAEIVSPNTDSQFILQNTHRTDFLTAGEFTHLYAALSTDRRRAIREKMLASGYTHVYLYAANERDYGGPEFDYYINPAIYRNRLQELTQSGLKPVVWLFPDDAPNLVAEYHPERLVETWAAFIPEIDDLVDSYVVGLEMDEYWAEEQQDFLGSALARLTDRPIFVHMTKTIWRQVLHDWASGIIYQYGFGKNVEEIRADTQTMLDRLEPHPRKVLIAGEYSVGLPEGQSIQLGDAAIQAGAHGFGNGGTSQRIIPALRSD